MIMLINPNEITHTLVLLNDEVHVFKGLLNETSLTKDKTPYVITKEYEDNVSIELNGFNSNLQYYKNILDSLTDLNLSNWFEDQKKLLTLYELIK